MGAVSRGKVSTSCCAVHCAVGCSVTLKWRTFRRSWAETISTKSTLNPTRGTVKKSRATSSVRWCFKKARQAGAGGHRGRTPYCSTGGFRHGFRRTTVRNVVNRGAPERVAMVITGRKTRSVFDRYHFVSPADLQETARKMAGTFSEREQGLRAEPPDFTGGRKWFRTTDPLLVRKGQSYQFLTGYSRMTNNVKELSILSYSLLHPVSARLGGSCLPNVCQKSRLSWAHAPDRTLGISGVRSASAACRC